MKKFFYFSDSSLKFVEIKNFKSKLLSIVAISSVIITTIVISVYLLIIQITNSQNDLLTLEKQNQLLKEKLIEITNQYSSLKSGLDSLSLLNENLRIAANLEPISDDERKLGVGGGNIVYLNSLNFDDYDFNNAMALVDEMTRRLEFEKEQYKEITIKFAENNKLFECIPAVMPTKGHYSINGFGMRLHPILKIRRFHSGLDINGNYGTPVVAPGNGTVSYVGRRAGYGRVIEINHGFGYKTIYAHLSKALVKRGQKVKRGDLIAKTGNSGLSSGPHLHYEVHHNGKKLNPVDFFFEDVNFFELNSKN